MHRSRSWRSRISYGFLALACCGPCLRAEAQSSTSRAAPSAVVFATTGPQTRRVHELDERIKRALGERDTLRVTVTPKLDLGSVQAALDCRNESVGCLRGVASEFGVDVLIAPAIELGQGDLVLTLLYFDARGAGSLVRVTHWQLGSKLTPDTLAAVPELVEALLPRTLAAPARGNVASSADVSKSAPAKPSRPLEHVAPAEQPSTLVQPSRPVIAGALPLAPCIVLASGVALIGAGVVTGVVMQGNAHDYRAQPVHTRAEADVAANTRQTLDTQAKLANILYGIGAGAAAVGSAWLLLELFGRSERDTSTHVAATVTPTQLGVVLRRRGDWL